MSSLKPTMMLNNLKTIALLIGLSLTLFSCSTDDDDNNNDQGNNGSGQTAQQVTNLAQSGTWVVSSFVDSGQDETNDFAGYSFDFQTDGTLVATNGNQTLNGTWSVTGSNSNDDGDSDNDFNIFFPVNEDHDFEDLNDDWDIVSATDNRIELLDVSGGNGGTDRLIFTKN